MGLRILHWTEHWRPLIGGVEVLVSHLAEAQAKRGHAVAVLTERPLDTLPAHEKEGEVGIHRLPLARALASQNTAGISAGLRALKTLLSEFKPEVVHLHTKNASIWYHRLAGIARKIPTVATVHAPLTHFTAPRPLLEQLWRDVDWITSVSEATRLELNSAFPVTTGKSSVVLNGLPPIDWAQMPLRAEPAVILCLGRLVPEKGFDLAIQAFARWRESVPAAELWIAGVGPERAALANLATSLHPAGSVRFLGAIDPADVPALISTASFVVMPSRWPEPFGLVAVQAGQSARPVVASRIGGLPEIVRDGETGRLFTPGDAAELGVIGSEWLADRALATRLGQAAQAHVLAHFSMNACADSFERIYVQQRKK